MKFDNIDVKNITATNFTGTYSGVDIEFLPGEVRHLPSHVARHIGLQLAAWIFRKQKDRGMPELLDAILSPESLTGEVVNDMTIKEQIEQHEKEFSEYLNNQKKEEILKRTNALEIEI